MEHLQTPIMTAAFVAYILALLAYALCFITSKDYFRTAGRFIVIAGFGLNTLLLVVRTMMTGIIPITNLFEFGLFFVWAMVGIFLIIDFKFDMWSAGIFVLPIAIALLIWLFTLDTSVRPIMPALRSHWLYSHVLTAVVAYGAFAVSCALSIMYLLKERAISKNKENVLTKSLPSLELLDNLSYKVIFIGMPFLTMVIVTGAIWAEYAWGTWWSWDPKETWSLITWFVYAAYLHLRFMNNWKGKRSAILSVVGFAAVLFTFIGVSYLLPGLHSRYASQVFLPMLLEYISYVFPGLYNIFA